MGAVQNDLEELEEQHSNQMMGPYEVMLANLDLKDAAPWASRSSATTYSNVHTQDLYLFAYVNPKNSRSLRR
jgi:hypothetical protein